MGLLRRGHRVAALSSLALALSLILPYAVLLKFYGYYSLNWLSISVALSLVGIAVAWRPFAPGPLAILPWIVPVSLMVTAVLIGHSAAEGRRKVTVSLNQDQENNRYIVQQVLRHQAEFANAETVALLGIDDIYSPWFLSSGCYINAKLGREIRWLLVAKPKSLVAKRMAGSWSKIGQIEVISEQELAARPGITILKFDKCLNLTIHVSGKH